MEAKKEDLLRKLTEKWHDAKCPYCGGNHWTVDPTIMTLSPTHIKPHKEGTEMLPVIAVTCQGCGNTVLVNAVVLDVVRKEEGTYANG